MEVGCPHCTTRFVLPPELLGPGGARVRCPSCSGQFEVAREARPEPAAPPVSRGPIEPPAGVAEAVRSPSIAPPAAARAPAAEEIAARLAVDALGERLAGMAEAWRHGRLFTEAGPALIAAFDDYRRRAGSGASPATFRRVLEERSGIAILEPAGEPSAVRFSPPLA